MKTAAIYARVSSDKQKEENTIASQTAALTAFAAEQGCAVPTEWIFEDEGYSGRQFDPSRPRAGARLGGRRRARRRAGLYTRSAQSTICLSDPADREVGSGR